MSISKEILDGLSKNSSKIKRLDLSNIPLKTKDISDLSTALIGNSNLSRISLKNNKMDDELAVIFCKSLPSTKITYLNLDNNKITLKGLNLIANYIKKSSVTELTLRGNLIDKACNESLSITTLIDENSPLLTLDLSDNKLSGIENSGFFVKLKSNKILQKLSLEKANLDDKSGEIIANFLSENNTLNFLNLSYNSLSDNSAVNIAFSLRKNKGLQTILMKKNLISYLTLAEFIFVSLLNKGLKSINLINNSVYTNFLIASITLSKGGDMKNSELYRVNEQINFVYNKIKNKAINLLNISRILFNFADSAKVNGAILTLMPEIKLMIFQQLAEDLLTEDQVLKIIATGSDKGTLSATNTQDSFLSSIDCVKSAKLLLGPQRQLFFAANNKSTDSAVAKTDLPRDLNF